MKIILCTTFRDFNGTDNDKIQYMFLDSIKNQTYQNYIVVTTTFGEKKVKDVVTECLGSKSVVKNVAIPQEYRFSLTDVVLSGIEVAEQSKEHSIIVWYTCDIQLKSDFFQVLIDNYRPDYSGIIHPNIVYNTLEDFKSKSGQVALLDGGIDLLFFDSSVLIKAKQDIVDFRFYDWGVFEYFLVALAMKYSPYRINLFNITKLRKILNDRKLTKETEAYFKKCSDMNLPILQKFFNENNICDFVWEGSGYKSHFKFKMLKDGLFSKYVKIHYILFHTDKGKNFRRKYHLTRLFDVLFKTKYVPYNQ